MKLNNSLLLKGHFITVIQLCIYVFNNLGILMEKMNIKWN